MKKFAHCVVLIVCVFAFSNCAQSATAPNPELKDGQEVEITGRVKYETQNEPVTDSKTVDGKLVVSLHVEQHLLLSIVSTNKDKGSEYFVWGDKFLDMMHLIGKPVAVRGKLSTRSERTSTNAEPVIRRYIDVQAITSAPANSPVSMLNGNAP